MLQLVQAEQQHFSQTEEIPPLYVIVCTALVECANFVKSQSDNDYKGITNWIFRVFQTSEISILLVHLVTSCADLCTQAMLQNTLTLYCPPHATVIFLLQQRLGSLSKCVRVSCAATLNAYKDTLNQ